jgi:hemolysin III
MTTAIRDEEKMNAATHGLGLGLATAGAIALIYVAVRHGDACQIAGCVAYSLTLVAAYAASTLSHVFRRPALRHAFRIADQAVIFLFIAGSYTPIAMSYLRGGPWWFLTGAVWGIALLGFLQKAVFAHRVTIGAVSVVLYVLLGWLPVLAARPLIAAAPRPLLIWILAGGLCYTAGILFFHYDHRVRYFHAAWHLMVIAGTACQYVGILMYCAGLFVR